MQWSIGQNANFICKVQIFILRNTLGIIKIIWSYDMSFKKISLDVSSSVFRFMLKLILIVNIYNCIDIDS